MAFYQYHQVEFDFQLIHFHIEDYLSLIFVGILAAIFSHKRLIVVKNYKDKFALQNWILSFFEDNNGEIFHQDEKLLFIRVKEGKKRFFIKPTSTYYQIKIKSDQALIIGPIYSMTRLMRQKMTQSKFELK